MLRLRRDAVRGSAQSARQSSPNGLLYGVLGGTTAASVTRCTAGLGDTALRRRDGDAGRDVPSPSGLEPSSASGRCAPSVAVGVAGGVSIARDAVADAGTSAMLARSEGSKARRGGT